MTEAELKQQLTNLSASLFARGYSAGGAGNISLVLPDGNILATPTNSCLGRLVPDELSVTDINGKHISGDAPTKELPLHLAVYKAKPDCIAVVHLHSTYITAFSCLADINTDDALRPFTPYYVMRVGRLPVVPYYKPGAKELGVEAIRAVKNASVFLLANHGAVVCGKSLVDAVNKAEELEETAKLYFILQSSHNAVKYLTDREIAELVSN
jgi:ribulose-5-phosphate 4-epimerase/fuculose-1-phosphate aldolase